MKRIVFLLLAVSLLLAVVVRSGKLFGYDWAGGRTAGQKVAMKVRIEKPTVSELELLGCGGGSLDEIEQGVWRVVQGGSDEGVVLNSAAFASHVYGYAGIVPLFIFVDRQGVIVRVALAANDESPDFLSHVAGSGLLDTWNGQPVAAAGDVKADVVSGATMTSSAVIETMKQTLAAYSGSAMHFSVSPAVGWTKSIAALGVLLSGIFVSFFRTANRKFRLVQLFLNVMVLGFWCGQFISLSLFLNWAENGFSVLAVLPLLVMAALALLLPLLGKKSYYCAWVCPLGGVQELAGKCCSRKMRLSQGWMKVLSYSRRVLFVLLVVLMWLGVGVEVVNYEPFSAFLFTVASPVVVGLAVLIFGLSFFINRPW